MLALLQKLKSKVNTIMATAAEINAKLDRQEALATEIHDDLKEVVELLANSGGLTGAEAQAISDRLSGQVTKLEEIAGIVPEPEPPV